MPRIIPWMLTLVPAVIVLGNILAAALAEPGGLTAGLAVVAALAAPLLAYQLTRLSQRAGFSFRSAEAFLAKRDPVSASTIQAEIVLRADVGGEQIADRIAQRKGIVLKRDGDALSHQDAGYSLAFYHEATQDDEHEDSGVRLVIERTLPTAKGLSKALLALGGYALDFLSSLPEGIQHAAIQYHVVPANGLDNAEVLRIAGMVTGTTRISLDRPTSDIADQLEDYVALHSVKSTS